MELMTVKNPTYLPSGSDDPDWPNDNDIIPPLSNAMESSRSYTFQVPKT
jgi:hypothetical protein